jgi:ABC-2 type transport system ATP-binding protein
MTPSGLPSSTVRASWTIGRVGALAVALGVGVGMFGGLGTAFADTDVSGADSGRSSSSSGQESGGSAATSDSSDSSDSAAPARRGESNGPRATTIRRGATAAAADPEDDLAATPEDLPPPAAEPANLPAVPAQTLPAQILPAQTLPAPRPAPRPAAALQSSAAAPATPASANDSSPVPAQNPAQAATQASAQASSSSSQNTITISEEVTWGGTFRGKEYPGILVGTLNAQSPLPLTYTLVSDPNMGGKLGSRANTAPSNVVFGPQGEFFYIPSAATLTEPGKIESFKVLVAETTPFDEFLTSLPLLGMLNASLITALHRTPILGNLLAPLIGNSEVVTFNVEPYKLALDPNNPAKQRPTAFTTTVASFDGLMVSTNYFPSTKVALGLVDSAPTVLNGPGLGAPGNTDVPNPYAQLSLFPSLDVPTPRSDQFGSLTPGLPVLRDGKWEPTDSSLSYDGGVGYNVITWDPRGEWDTRDRKLPGLQIDNPFFEGRDASAIISWASSAANPARTQVKMESPGDPLIGMVGGSYGGGIQWVTAATDPRVDAISPQISWNSLISSLYPNTNQFKTGWGSILLLALAASGAQINPQIYAGIGTGVTLGWLSETAQAVLSSAGPTALLNNIDIPTLIFQGMEDGLFQLQESVTNAESIYDNRGATTKLVWFCGGHGTCTTPLNPDQDDRGLIDNLKWLDQYLAGSGTPAEGIPAFQWYDQMGFYYSSDKLPFEPGFNLPQPYSTAANGGLLGVWPLLGGSGPGRVEGVSPLLTFPNATPAWNALNTNVTVPADSQVVGAPELSFTYQGLGTSRTVYAQLIDETTGKVLQNLVTPIPVVLDGRERTVSIPLANIAYTSTGGSLRLQITSSATNFENFTSYGLVNISDVTLDLPIVA